MVVRSPPFGSIDVRFRAILVIVANSTVISPLFLKNAEETRERLSRLGGAGAAALAEEADSLARIFRAWQAQRPTDEVRVAAIQRLFDVNRRAMDLLMRQGPISSPRPTLSHEEEDDGDLLDAAISRRRG